MPYQMPNGKWRAKRMIDGKVKTKSFATKREAQKWEIEQTAESWQQTEQCQLTHSACFLEIMTDYLTNIKDRVSHKTLNEKKLALRQLFADIAPDTMPEQLTPAVVLRTLQRIARTVSGNAANKCRKNLASAWEWGKKYHGLTGNPFRESDKFPADEQPRYVPPEADFWRVYEAASKHDKVFLLFMLHTGARKGEVFRLQWADIDFANSKVRLGTRKTASGGMEYAWIPMTSELQTALAEYRRETTSLTYVFTQAKTGEPYTSRQHYMSMLCRQAGVKPFGFHAIRHLSATILAYAGLDIPTVQAMLRHQNPNTTARYIKSLGIQQDKIDAVFSKRKEVKTIDFNQPKKAIGT